MRFINIFYFIVFVYQVGFSQNKKKQFSFKSLTIEDGLSQNSVIDIVQDNTGYMWFATQDGLNKYNGNTFTYFNKQFEDVTRTNYSKLGKIFIDNAGVLWIITNSGKLEKYNSIKDNFSKINTFKNVSVFYQNSKNDYFIGTYSGKVYKLNSKSKEINKLKIGSKTNEIIYAFKEQKRHTLVLTSLGIYKIIGSKIKKINSLEKSISYNTIVEDKNKINWLATHKNGLFFMDINDSIPQKFTHKKLPKNFTINDLLIDKKNRLWIATYGKGLFLLDVNMNEITHFEENKNNPFAIQYNDILSLYEDNTGLIWIGTDGSGLTYYDEHLFKFNLITNKQAPHKINVSLVRAITATNSNNDIWLGTSGKGLTLYDSKNNIYKTFTAKNSLLASNRIMSLLATDDKILIGHQNFGLQIKDLNNNFYSFSDTSKMTIWKIYKDKNSNIWLCTRDNGLLLFDINKGILKRVDTQNSVLKSNNVRTVEESEKGNLWIGTENDGLYQLNINNFKINEVLNAPKKIKSLLYKNHFLWIGTNGNGLAKLNPLTKNIKIYTQKDGLPNEVIYGILPDNFNNLWLSTNKGISKFTINDSITKIENYSNDIALQAQEFNTGAYFKDDKGTLYFGGLEGVNWFDANQLSYNLAPPKTVITDVKLFNEAILFDKKKVFKSYENTLTFTFSSLHYSQPKRNLYKYILINNDKNWTEPTANNVAHYTNLPPNTYTLKVISSNYDGVWSTKPTEYSFIILKPWYLSTLAKIIYFILLIIVLFLIYKYVKFRLKNKLDFQLAAIENQHLKKIDAFKSKLFTNISHEFRTPLTVIQGLSNTLEKRSQNDADKNTLKSIHNNAYLLNEQLNQLLTLSALEKDSLDFYYINDNIVTYIKSICAFFESFAESKAQKIAFKTAKAKINMDFDPEKIRSIIQNIISNALKFNTAKSIIKVDLKLENQNLIITIKDEGIGIAKENLDKIFDRFYTTKDQNNIEGSGIGLALVKELVEKTKGTIKVISVLNKGTTFCITLPITQVAEKRTATSPPLLPFKTIDKKPENDILKIDGSEIIKKKNTVLIIEDNKDIHLYYKELLQNKYNIIKANDGKEALKKLDKNAVDLIISDLSMPKMDGYHFAKTLKENRENSHIPFIIVSANISVSAKKKLYNLGIDSYLTKPFEEEELISIINNLLFKKTQNNNYFAELLALKKKPHHNEINALDIKFIKEIQELALKSVIYTTQEIADKMRISRSKLNHKVTTLTGKSVGSYIKHIKIEKAKELLKNTDLQINEIAFKLGYNEPSLFSKVFKKETGISPKLFREKQNN